MRIGAPFVCVGAVQVRSKPGPATATASKAPGVALKVEMLCRDMPWVAAVPGGACDGPRGIAITTAGVPAPEVLTPVTRKKYGVPLFKDVTPAESDVVAAATVVQAAPLAEYSTRYESAPATAVHVRFTV